MTDKTNPELSNVHYVVCQVKECHIGTAYPETHEQTFHPGERVQFARAPTPKTNGTVKRP